jgi:hypothetical protein
MPVSEPDREALVDSKFRVTWAEAKKLTDAIADAWIAGGFAQGFPRYHPIPEQRLRVSGS